MAKIQTYQIVLLIAIALLIYLGPQIFFIMLHSGNSDNNHLQGIEYYNVVKQGNNVVYSNPASTVYKMWGCPQGQDFEPPWFCPSGDWIYNGIPEGSVASSYLNYFGNYQTYTCTVTGRIICIGKGESYDDSTTCKQITPVYYNITGTVAPVYSDIQNQDGTYDIQPYPFACRIPKSSIFGLVQSTYTPPWGGTSTVTAVYIDSTVGKVTFTSNAASYDSADTNYDGVVSRTELGTQINKWIAGTATRDELGQSIVAWIG